MDCVKQESASASVVPQDEACQNLKQIAVCSCSFAHEARTPTALFQESGGVRIELLLDANIGEFIR